MDAADRSASVGTSTGKFYAYQGSMNRFLAEVYSVCSRCRCRSRSRLRSMPGQFFRARWRSYIVASLSAELL